MKELIILLAMIWLHIFADYNLQGILANLKQKAWWDQNAPGEFYANDYKTALIEHSFSWTFVIMLPAVVCYIFNLHDVNLVVYFLWFVINVCLHAFIDNDKANKLRINLSTDQAIHFAQVVMTWFCIFIL